MLYSDTNNIIYVVPIAKVLLYQVNEINFLLFFLLFGNHRSGSWVSLRPDVAMY